MSIQALKLINKMLSIRVSACLFALFSFFQKVWRGEGNYRSDSHRGLRDKAAPASKQQHSYLRRGLF